MAVCVKIRMRELPVMASSWDSKVSRKSFLCMGIEILSRAPIIRCRVLGPSVEKGPEDGRQKNNPRTVGVKHHVRGLLDRVIRC